RRFFIHAPRSVRGIPHPLLVLLIRPLNASHMHARRAHSRAQHPATKPNVALPCYPTRSHSPLAERLNCQPPTSPLCVAELRTRRRCQLDAPLSRYLRCKPDTALAIPRAPTRPAASAGLTLSPLRAHIYVIYHTLHHHPPSVATVHSHL
ncbi:hypothetical protein K438DRAFT_1870387, partial [Mycena galopus ATCC 62051]